jgi:hypothetical protein
VTFYLCCREVLQELPLVYAVCVTGLGLWLVMPSMHACRCLFADVDWSLAYCLDR